MKYVSLFSGIEAASVAWDGLGWEPLCFAELDEFPSAVLAERFPDVPNVGDVTKVNWKRYKGKCDLVVGGSPCQSFSVAGKREGLQGESGLMFEYIRAVREIRPRWFLWENVPGALSSEGGEAFRQLLSEMDKLGYGLAWRVLDAQFFGVAQRRRRVFLVGHLGACPPVEVLLEPESLRGDYPSSREKRQELAAATGRCASSAGFKFHKGIGDAGCLNPEDNQSKRIFTPDSCAPTLSSGNGEGMSIQPSVLCIQGSMIGRSDRNGPQGSGIEQDGASFTLNCTDRNGVLAFAQNTRDEVRIVGDGTLSGALAANPGMKQTTYICMADDNAKAAIDRDMCGSLKVGGATPMVTQQRRSATHALGTSTERQSDVTTGKVVVRRLTPKECERLQGFPDDWTKIPYRGKTSDDCPDGPRYKAIGNSMAVPVMKWIGERIDLADKEELRNG